MPLQTIEPASAVIKIRLTQAQVAAIWPGLNHLVLANLTREAAGQALTSFPIRIQPLPAGVNAGKFSPPMMNRVGWLWTKLQSLKTSGGDVQLDAFELRAAAFSARTSVKAARLKVRKARKRGADAKRSATAARRTVDKLSRKTKAAVEFLEVAMKRAERQFVLVAGRDQYKALAAEWQSHLQWMKLHLAYFKPFRPTRVSQRQRESEYVDRLVKMAGEAILVRKLKLPSPKSLRQAIRSFLANSRRGRIGRYDHVYMITHTDSPVAKAKLFEFIERRLYLERAS